MQTNKRAFLMICILAGGFFSLSAGSVNSEKRSFLFGVELGWANPVYGEPLDSNVEELESYPGISRASLGLGVEAGWLPRKICILLGG